MVKSTSNGQGKQCTKEHCPKPKQTGRILSGNSQHKSNTTRVQVIRWTGVRVIRMRSWADNAYDRTCVVVHLRTLSATAVIGYLH